MAVEHCEHAKDYICLACLLCPDCGCKGNRHFIYFKSGETGCADHPTCPGFFAALNAEPTRAKST